MEQNEQFNFTYSAQQQKEVEAIRSKYLPKAPDKMEQLRNLHAIPTRKATRIAIILGILGALILGAGMSLCMTELGVILGGYRDYSMPIGIVVGLIGMVLAALAYPVFLRTLKKEREKIAPEILKLTDELLQ